MACESYIRQHFADSIYFLQLELFLRFAEISMLLPILLYLRIKQLIENFTWESSGIIRFDLDPCFKVRLCLHPNKDLYLLHYWSL